MSLIDKTLDSDGLHISLALAIGDLKSGTCKLRGTSSQKIPICRIDGVTKVQFSL